MFRKAVAAGAACACFSLAPPPTTSWQGRPHIFSGGAVSTSYYDALHDNRGEDYSPGRAKDDIVTIGSISVSHWPGDDHDSDGWSGPVPGACDGTASYATPADALRA
jgi:hypothetical protein